MDYNTVKKSHHISQHMLLVHFGLSHRIITDVSSPIDFFDFFRSRISTKGKILTITHTIQ